jgi:predicted nucleic acid-binding protein
MRAGRNGDGGAAFLDTNVSSTSRLGVVSYQVVQEFLNVAVRKFEERMSASATQVFLQRILWPMCEVFPDLDLYSEAISVREETGWDFYDSLIVSAAVRAGCPVLLTEDLQAGRKVRGVEIRNPFSAISEV